MRLPSGTSAPDTVITDHAVAKYGLHEHVAGWLITTPRPLSAQQISQVRAIAAAATAGALGLLGAALGAAGAMIAGFA